MYSIKNELNTGQKPNSALHNTLLQNYPIFQLQFLHECMPNRYLPPAGLADTENVFLIVENRSWCGANLPQETLLMPRQHNSQDPWDTQTFHCRSSRHIQLVGGPGVDPEHGGENIYLCWEHLVITIEGAVKQLYLYLWIYNFYIITIISV